MFLEIIAVVTVVAAALLAFGFGGRDKQLAAIGFLAATLATRMITAEYQHVEYGVLALVCCLACWPWRSPVTASGRCMPRRSSWLACWSTSAASPLRVAAWPGLMRLA